MRMLVRNGTRRKRPGRDAASADSRPVVQVVCEDSTTSGRNAWRRVADEREDWCEPGRHEAAEGPVDVVSNSVCPARAISHGADSPADGGWGSVR
jgi:hypothetical protein